VVGNNEIDLEERVWDIMDWIYLAQDWDIRRVFCQHSNKSAGFLKCGEFQDLGNSYLLKKGCAPRSYKLGKE
jgi:hypothetical protein